jgi:hypothetical protein
MTTCSRSRADSGHCGRERQAGSPRADAGAAAADRALAGSAASGGGGGGADRPQLEKPDEGLPKIAAATGGGYFELTSARDLPSTFARVADELHHQYALGFTPEKLDGKMHDLTVRLSRADLAARARKRYLASKPLGGA